MRSYQSTFLINESDSHKLFSVHIFQEFKCNAPKKLKKEQVQYSVPGPGPVWAAPLRPRCVPAAGGSSAEATDLSELPVPGLCPAAQSKITADCMNSANHTDNFNQKRKSVYEAYLSQKLREHFHVIVSLGHLLHALGTEDWPEKDFLLAGSTKVHTHHVHAKNSAQKQYKLQTKGHTAMACQLPSNHNKLHLC